MTEPIYDETVAEVVDAERQAASAADDAQGAADQRQEHAEAYAEAVRKRPAGNIHPKVANSALVGAAVTVIVFTAGQFGLEVPQGVGVALGVLLSFLAGYATSSPE